MPIQACRTTSFREVCRGNPSQRGTKHTKRAPLTVLLGVLAWCRKCEASAPKLYVHSDLSIVERQILARETRLKQFSARETSNDFGMSFFCWCRSVKPSNANKKYALTTIKTEAKRTLSTAASVHRTCQEVFCGLFSSCFISTSGFSFSRNHNISTDVWDLGFMPFVVDQLELLISHQRWKISHCVNPYINPKKETLMRQSTRQPLEYCKQRVYSCQKCTMEMELTQWKCISSSLQHSTQAPGILKVQPPFLQAPTSLSALKFREWACRPDEGWTKWKLIPVGYQQHVAAHQHAHIP